MNAAEILRGLASIIDGASTQTAPEQEIHADLEDHTETSTMIPPLQQKMELMKKMAGEESYYDKPCDTCGHTPCECDSEQPDEVEIVKKNAGLVPVTAMMLGGDEPFEG
jgi:hypothetical protein